MAVCEQPVALVTGSGHGIGRGIALQLARDRYFVIVNGVSGDPSNTEDGAYEVKKTIETAGGKAEVCLADISNPVSRTALGDYIADRFGRLDLLVNNAGVAPKERLDILEGTEESFDRLMGINLKGPYFLTQALAKRMIAWQAAGIVPTPRICFVTSISAYASSPNRGEYCVSKAGLSMGAMLFADRLGEYGIPVIEICPGITATRMTGPVKEKYDKLIAEGLLVTKRWGLPEDTARLIAAFARGDLDYSTGARIEVGGGFGLTRL